MDFDNVIIRQILKSGDTLGLGYEKCIIDTVRGEGTSCIVYEAMLDGRRVILKELYPRGLGIKRDTNNSLIIPDSQKENFEYYKTRLKRAFDIQLEFHNDVQTTNYTVESQLMIKSALQISLRFWKQSRHYLVQFSFIIKNSFYTWI